MEITSDVVITIFAFVSTFSFVFFSKTKCAFRSRSLFRLIFFFFFGSIFNFRSKKLLKFRINIQCRVCVCAFFLAKILDPFRPTRRFSAPKEADDGGQTVKDKQAARWERLNALAEETVDEIALEKKKAQREEASRLLEEQ